MLVLILIWSVSGQALADTYRFSAPPRSGVEESRSLFTPLMDLLSGRTGQTFVYIHPDGWFSYQTDIRKGRYDLLLDDAHFASWRIASLGYLPLVRASSSVRFVAVAPRDGRVYSKEDLIGEPVCTYPPPDLGTVSFLRKFHGPFQVPRILATPDPLDRIKRLLAGECAAAVLSRHLYSESDEMRDVAHRLKIITQTDAYPGLTLTVNPRVPEALRNEIRGILLSPAGQQATAKLRNALAHGDDFVAASSKDYAGLAKLLANYPGFEKP
ncbi:MAG: PhnD/SsuA/transferrin family substrate-binding protein [Arenicellales bacterium]